MFSLNWFKLSFAGIFNLEKGRYFHYPIAYNPIASYTYPIASYTHPIASYTHPIAYFHYPIAYDQMFFRYA